MAVPSVVYTSTQTTPRTAQMASPKHYVSTAFLVLICFCSALSSAHPGVLADVDHLPKSISTMNGGGGWGGGAGIGTYHDCGGPPGLACPCPSYCPPAYPPPGFGCCHDEYCLEVELRPIRNPDGGSVHSPAVKRYEAAAQDGHSSVSPKGSKAVPPPSAPPSSLKQ